MSKILVVDDSKVMRDMVSACLKSAPDFVDGILAEVTALLEPRA